MQLYSRIAKDSDILSVWPNC